jgi:hypothetical protein
MMLPLRLATRHSPFRSQRWGHSIPSFSHLNTVTEQDLAHFSKILPPTSILSTLPPSATPIDDLAPYNVDWMGKYHGQANTVLRPRTTQQVSAIVKYCASQRIGIVSQGGNTGLVGGSISLQKEIVLNLGAMNNVRSFDPVSGNWCSSCLYSNEIQALLFFALRYLGRRRGMHPRISKQSHRPLQSYYAN